jgi:hypothetical protein
MSRAAAFLLTGLFAGLAGLQHVDAGGRHSDKLLKALSGRSALPDAACVNLHDLDGHRIFPRDKAVVFEGPGSLVYLNRFNGVCDNLVDGVSLRLSTPTGRLCRGDIVQMFEPMDGSSRGACALGDFTPFRRAL